MIVLYNHIVDQCYMVGFFSTITLFGFVWVEMALRVYNEIYDEIKYFIKTYWNMFWKALELSYLVTNMPKNLGFSANKFKLKKNS